MNCCQKLSTPWPLLFKLDAAGKAKVEKLFGKPAQSL